MNTHPRYDVFLSYRREGADGTARLFYERLLHDGYRVAFDLETLRSGDFDEQILGTIRSCRDMVVFLSPGALDRCVHEGDWVRRELACALDAGINVIPVLLRGFAFPPPDELPPDIRGIVRKQGVSASMEHLDSTVVKLERLLTSRPTSRFCRHALAWAANLAVACLLLGAAILFIRPSAPDRGAADTPRDTVPSWQTNETQAARSEENSFVATAGRTLLSGNPAHPSPPLVVPTVWTPYAPHPDCPNVRASTVEGQWEPEPGFRFSNADPESLTVFRNRTKIIPPFRIDLSCLTLEERKTIITNLFFSSHNDGAFDNWEETDGEFRVLAEAFEDGFIAKVVKPPEGGWRAKLAQGGVQRQYSALCIAMVEARADDCAGLERILNEIADAFPDEPESVLNRGTLRRVWREIPRWPARKPDMPPRPPEPEKAADMTEPPRPANSPPASFADKTDLLKVSKKKR